MSYVTLQKNVGPNTQTNRTITKISDCGLDRNINYVISNRLYLPDANATYHRLDVSKMRLISHCLMKLNSFQLHDGEETETNSGSIEVNLLPTSFNSQPVTVVTDLAQLNPRALS